MQRFLPFLAIALTLFLGSSCSATKGLDNPLKLLTGNDWELSSLLGKAVDIGDFTKGLPFLKFGDDGALSGSTGCNNFSGNFDLDGKNLNLDPGAMTKMACPGDGEDMFLDALGSVSSFKMDDGALSLLNDADELLKFVPKKKE